MSLNVKDDIYQDATCEILEFPQLKNTYLMHITTPSVDGLFKAPICNNSQWSFKTVHMSDQLVKCLTHDSKVLVNS